MRLFLILTIALFPFIAKAQTIVADEQINTNLNVKVEVDQGSGMATITITGQNGVWNGVGFGGTTMPGRYAFIVLGNGNVQERRLGSNSSGTLLSSTHTVQSNTVNGSFRTVVLTRAIQGMNSNYYTFPTNPTTINIIWGRGNGSSLAYHAARGSTTMTFTNACTPVTHTLPDLTICQGDSVQIFGSFQSQASTYQTVLTNSQGCDSTVFQTLIVNPIHQVTLNQITICQGDSALIFGIFQTGGGIYHQANQNQFGCDSTVSQELLVQASSTTQLPNQTLCDGDSILFEGQIISSPGTYTATLTNQFGCDSILSQTFDQGLSDSILLPPLSICEGDSVSIFGTHQSLPGLYTDSQVNLSGCDSIRYQELMVHPADSQTLPLIEICQGETTMVFGNQISSSGLYTNVLSNVQGCDSTLIQEVQVNPNHFLGLPEIQICTGDSVLIFGSFERQSGSYFDSLTTSSGCDSILEQVLIVRNSIQVNLPTIEICQGDSALVFGNLVQMPGTYTDTTQSQGGCNSISSVDLIVLPQATSQIQDSICQGETYPFHGMNISQAGNYTATLQTSAGCDSIVSLILRVNQPRFDTLPSLSVCMGDSTLIFGQYQSQAGIYQNVLIGSNGCDSNLYQSLTVIPASQGQDTAQICKGDSIFIGGEFQTQPGLYTDVLTNQLGCDSILVTTLLVDTLDLRVEASLDGSSVYVPGIQDSIYWIDCSTGLPIPGAVQFLLNPGYNGDFAAVVTKRNCMDTTECASIRGIGIQEEGKKNMNFFPNPSSDYINWTNQYTWETLTIIGLDGRVYLRTNLKPNQNRLNVQHLPPGLYIVQFQGPESVRQGRIEVLR